ncbi:MAG: DMT family transporter [Granulosicoccus sp.]|nr:DMT family transporter [Granulosicoccus sp.]
MVEKDTHWQTGILLMIAGTFIIPGMDAIAKYLSDSLSPAQITWGRFLFQCLFMGSAIGLMDGHQGFKSRIKHIHALRGLLLAAATGIFFLSLKYLPLADAIAIFFVQPMILTVISGVFLGEDIGWYRRIAVCTGFAGALLIIRPAAESFTAASLLPLLTATLFSAYLALTKAWSNIDSPRVMQFFSGISALAILSIVLLIGTTGSIDTLLFTPPTRSEWFWLAAIGAVSACGHLLIVMAMSRAPASVLAPFGYMEIIAATTLGWLIFNDWPEPLTWMGIGIIVASGICVYYRERRLATSAHVG